jgi:hypothetical protein
MPVLLICVDGSASDEQADVCRQHYESLSAQHWTYPPEFVDQVDDEPVSGEDDLPAIRTAGAYVELPEPGEAPDEAAVRRDVAALIESMSALAAETSIELAVEYREEEIGLLDGGPGDGKLVEGIFGS